MAKLNEEMKKAIEKLSDNLYKEEIYINGYHEYDYHKLSVNPTATVHTLYFSSSNEWSDGIKSKVAMQLIDNGSGIELIGVNSKKEISYLEAEQLHILLRLSSTHIVYQIAEPTTKKEF